MSRWVWRRKSLAVAGRDGAWQGSLRPTKIKTFTPREWTPASQSSLSVFFMACLSKIDSFHPPLLSQLSAPQHTAILFSFSTTAAVDSSWQWRQSVILMVCIGGGAWRCWNIWLLASPTISLTYFLKISEEILNWSHNVSLATWRCGILWSLVLSILPSPTFRKHWNSRGKRLGNNYLAVSQLKDTHLHNHIHWQQGGQL